MVVWWVIIAIIIAVIFILFWILRPHKEASEGDASIGKRVMNFIDKCCAKLRIK